MHSFAIRVVRWQRRHGRHDLPWQASADPYRVWLSEVMLQQTRVETAIPYYQRFLERFPDVRSLARASVDEVLRLWSGLGYYARARNLHAAARRIVKVHAGCLPDRVEALAMLPGIGRSTAGAIAALAFGRPAPMLDANARRVLERSFAIHDDKGLWRLAAELVPARSVAAYTQGLMDLGAMICTARAPACGRCPVSRDCRTRSAGLAAPRSAKRALPVRSARWLVLVHRDRVLLERRPPRGIWGGLWTLPETRARDAKTEAAKRGCSTTSVRALPPFDHGFTHLRLRIRPILCFVGGVRATTTRERRRWLRLSEAEAAALPAPVRKLLLSLRPGTP